MVADHLGGPLPNLSERHLAPVSVDAVDEHPEFGEIERMAVWNGLCNPAETGGVDVDPAGKRRQ